MLNKTLLATLLTGAGFTALAQSPVPPGMQPATWFTVMGDPDDPTINTVQVDPVDRDSNPKTMQVRVSRSAPRTSWDGVPYRSYASNVSFECERNQARYLSVTYYTEPGWQGEPTKTVDYTTGTQRMMEFRDVTPNPTRRIIHAACSLVARR